MTKLLGFTLLQLAAALFAGRHIMNRRLETETLHSFCAMLEQLRGLMEDDGSPMPALLQTLSTRSTGRAQTFVCDLLAAMDSLGELQFQELWHQKLEENGSNLEENGRRELESLGCVLGRYDLSTELEAIAVCISHMRHRLDERQSAQKQDTRMILGLSFSFSLLLGILLA